MKRGRIKQSYKPKDYDPAATAAFHAAGTTAGRRCAVCGRRSQLQAHHGLPKTHIADFCRENGLHGAARDALVWAPENAIGLCPSCHERHTNASRRMLRSELPGRVWDFARKLDAIPSRRGPEWATVRLEREYPV